MPRLVRSSIFVLALLVIVFGTLRLAFVTADGPTRLPNAADGYELFAEPVAKAHEARSRALFGAWHTNPADNYQYWRVQSPVWVYPLWIWFELFGASIASLRIFSTFVAAIGFAVTMVFAHRRLGLLGTFLAGAFIATNFYGILYERSGLIEVAIGCWTAVFVYTLDRARNDATWLVASAWALAAGFLSKQTMVTLGPMFLVLGLGAYVRWLRSSSAPWWRKVLPPANGLALLGGLLLYCSTPQYERVLKRNFKHMVGSREVSEIEVGGVLERVLDWSLWYDGYFSLMPIVSVLALAQVVRWLVGLPRGGPRDAGWTTTCVAWLFSAAIAFFTTQVELRFRMLLFAPASLLAAALIVDTARWSSNVIANRLNGEHGRTSRFVAPVLVAAALAASVSFDVKWYSNWIGTRTYVVETANREIREAIGERSAVVVGSWAPEFVFDTPYQFYYVRSEFNSSKARLRRLGITHLLLMSRRDFSGRILRREFSDLGSRIRKQTSFVYRGRNITLYAVVSGLPPPP